MKTPEVDDHNEASEDTEARKPTTKHARQHKWADEQRNGLVQALAVLVIVALVATGVRPLGRLLHKAFGPTKPYQPVRDGIRPEDMEKLRRSLANVPVQAHRASEGSKGQDGTKEALGKATMDWYSSCPLARAVEAGDVEQVKLILEQTKAADVNSKEPTTGCSLLHLAILAKQPDVAFSLVAAGADVNARGRQRLLGEPDRPRSLADLFRDPESSQLPPGSEASSKTPQGKAQEPPFTDGLTPLHLAAMVGDCKSAQLLLDKGADIEAQDSDGRRPLHYVASRDLRALLMRIRGKGDVRKNPGHVAVARLLLSKGASVSPRDKNEETPLHLAAIVDRADVAEVLIVNGADLDAKAENGETPLAVAQAFGRTQVVELLREHATNEPEKAALEAD